MQSPYPTSPGRPRLDGGDVWLFDLDNTLYPASCDLFPQIDRRMGEFIQRFLSLGRDEARLLQKHYLREHGTTLRGLMLNHGLRPQDYLDFVHAVDLTAIAPSPALDAALAALPGRKLVFTNASTAHAERVLTRLGVDRHFEVVFDIAAADYQPKPMPECYRRLIDRHGVEPRRAVFFEDSARNLEPAAALGMTTVLVREESATAGDALADFVHHVTADLLSWLNGLLQAARPPDGPR
jgi:putative hydrolase of the HAD superfamily